MRAPHQSPTVRNPAIIRHVWRAAIPALLLLGAGCGRLQELLQPDTVTVRLVNDGTFAVQTDVYIYDHQEAPRSVLTELGTKLEYTIGPGETATFSRRCADLQAITVDHAQLMLIGQIGPTADTDVFRDGSDFHCGDTVVFTFDHSVLLVDFDIAFSVLPSTP